MLRGAYENADCSFFNNGPCPHNIGISKVLSSCADNALKNFNPIPPLFVEDLQSKKNVLITGTYGEINWVDWVEHCVQATRGVMRAEQLLTHL